MSNVTKKIINSKLLTGIVYTIPITITDIVDGVNISWDSFTFYSPTGNFVVEAINKDILRDDTLNKTCMISVTRGTNNVDIVHILEGQEYHVTFNTEGDIILWLNIPTNDLEDISGFYKEMIDGS